jgi:hypothetical protein
MARKQTNGHSNDDPTKPWQFKKGHKPLEGVGRPKGMPNHETRVLKDAVMVAARLTGDVDLIPARTIKADKARLEAIAALYEESEEDAAKRAGLVGYLCYLARNHPRSYASLLARVLPLQIKMEAHETVIYRSTQEILQSIKEMRLPLKRLMPLLIDMSEAETVETTEKGQEK